MGVTININNLSLCHKGSSGVATATVPDVCKTPSPPVLVPYPNIARSSALSKGTTTVHVDGGNSAAIKGSEFSTSSGDEAGTLGGVKSGVNMKEATWLTYSFDVKLEGKSACRLTDKMLMNHGNTVCLAGEVQRAIGTKPKRWDMDCLLKILCKKDRDVVKKAKNLEVTRAAVFFDDKIYKNGKWELHSKQWGGSAKGNKVVISTNTSCEGAAETVYHEVLHTEQPPSMSWEAKEMEAYTKGEEWSIARGLPGRPAFRTIDASGKTVVNTQAIYDMLHKEYPLGITNVSADGTQVKENGVWRAAKEGDKLAGPQRLKNAKKIDPKEFKCP